MPIDLVCCERDTLRVGVRHRFETDDEYFRDLGKQWRDGVREVFRRLPAVPSHEALN
jgi:predicted proteasome-type protease